MKIESEKSLLANIANSQSARFARNVAQQYTRRGRTVALYRYTELAIVRLAVQSHRWAEARQHRLKLSRAMRKFDRKGNR